MAFPSSALGHPALRPVKNQKTNILYEKDQKYYLQINQILTIKAIDCSLPQHQFSVLGSLPAVDPDPRTDKPDPTGR